MKKNTKILVIISLILILIGINTVSAENTDKINEKYFKKKIYYS